MIFTLKPCPILISNDDMTQPSYRGMIEMGIPEVTLDDNAGTRPAIVTYFDGHQASMVLLSRQNMSA